MHVGVACHGSINLPCLFICILRSFFSFPFSSSSQRQMRHHCFFFFFLAPFGWQMSFRLARNLEPAVCPVIQLLIFYITEVPRGHRGKISAPPSRWQKTFCVSSRRATKRSFRVWQRSSSISAHLLLLPNRCSGDGGVYTDGSLPVVQTTLIFAH